MATMRTHFQRQLYPGLKEVIFDSYMEKPMQSTQIYRVDSSDKAFEEFQTMAGMGLFVRTPEGVEVSQDRFFDGFYSRFNHEAYTLGIGFTHEAQRDLKTRIFAERSMDMGRSARSTQEILRAAILNLAFVGGTIGPDGKTLCAVDHPNIRGGTQSNIISPVGTLSVTTLRRMLTKARRFFDDTGQRRVQLMLEWLVVPPEEEYNAMEILKSSTRPDTTNRADNVTRDALKAFVYDYLTSTVNWFGVSSKQQHHMHVFIREAFGTTEFEEEKPRINWIQGYFAESQGFTHWMGVIGVNPV